MVADELRQIAKGFVNDKVVVFDHMIYERRSTCLLLLNIAEVVENAFCCFHYDLEMKYEIIYTLSGLNLIIYREYSTLVLCDKLRYTYLPHVK